MELNSIRHLRGGRREDLIAEGVTNAQTLAASVTTRIKRKEDVVKALTNEHIFVLQKLMGQY